MRLWLWSLLLICAVHSQNNSDSNECQNAFQLVSGACGDNTNPQQVCTTACEQAVTNAIPKCQADSALSGQLTTLQQTRREVCSSSGGGGGSGGAGVPTPSGPSGLPGPLANLSSIVGSYCREKLTVAYDACLDQSNPQKACTQRCSLSLKDAQPACSEDPVFGEQYRQITEYVNNICRGNSTGTIPQERSVCNLTQSLCSPNFADIGPKWCRFNNPFIYVMNVSDAKFGNTPCFGSSCENNTGSLDLTCGEGPYGDCVGVTAITAAKVIVAESVFAPVKVSEESRLLTTIWMGHQSGSITVTMVAPFLRNRFGVVQQNLAVLAAHKSAILRLSTLDASDEFPSQAMVLSSSEEVSKLWRVNADAWPLPSFQLPCSEITHPPNTQLIKTALFHSPTRMVRFALLFRPVSSVSGPYTLILGSVDLSQSFFRACPSVKQSLHTWSISLHFSVTAIIDMQILTHSEWKKTTDITDEKQTANVRTLLMLSSSVAVGSYLLESEVYPLPTSPVSIEFGNPNLPSTLYHVSRTSFFASNDNKQQFSPSPSSNQQQKQKQTGLVSLEHFAEATHSNEIKITTAKLVGEAFRSFDFTDLSRVTGQLNGDSQGENWRVSQLVWLIVAVTINKQPWLQFISFNEFLSVHDNVQQQQQQERISDPSYRKSKWQECATNTEWFSPETQNCTNRRAYGVKLPGTSSRISVRYRDIPPDLKNADKWQELSKDFDRVPLTEPLQQAQQRCAATKGKCNIPNLDAGDILSLTQLLANPTLTNSPACTNYYQCLRSASSENSPCPILAKQDNRENLEKVLQNFLYFNIFVQIDEDAASLRSHVLIFSMQAELGSNDRLLIEYDNELEFIGTMQDMYVSINSLHLLAVVKRHNFDVDGTERLVDLCDKLRQDPDNIFLQSFKGFCEKYGLRPQFNIADFVWYASACPPGTYCPDFFNTVIYPRRDASKAFRNTSSNTPTPSSPSPASNPSTGVVKQELTGDFLPDGFYTMRTFELRVCEPGFFCVQGTRIACPIGFKCPDVGMQRPIGCGFSPSHNETCFHERPSWEPGLTEPTTCGEGQLCIVSYLPGLPAPPGYAITHPPNKPRVIQSCSEGDWCVLGRSFEDELKCPANTYCTNASVLTPTICNFSQNFAYYCPEGTSMQQPCRAGQFCPMPNITVNCSSHRYCPAGSFKADACPAGYYCTNPSVSEICPSGYVCTVGSLFPRPCRFLSFCPEGSSTEGKSFAGVLAVAAIFATPAILYQFYKRWKKHRHGKKKQARRSQVVPEQELTEIGNSLEEMGEGELSSRPSRGSDPPPHTYVTLSTPKKPSSSAYRIAAAAAVDDNNNNNNNTSNSMMEPPSPVAWRTSVHIDVEFIGLGYQLNNGARILNNLHGEIRHGELTGIMGPSGAGKTSLLAVLCDKVTEGQITGKMLINGKEEKLAKYKKLVGFVPQNDVMHYDLTVKENIEFSAATRLPSYMTKKEVEEQVRKVLKVLNLSKVKNQVIGDDRKRGISGGQRKRVNIAMELVADPTILFLDEPTSGLDSTAAKDVLLHLRQIAQMGLTVITCLHQPRFEIFEMLDRCLLLGFGGQMVYNGMAREALGYFKKVGFEPPPHMNPSDFFMDVISGDVPREGHPNFVPADLIDFWNEQRGEKESKKTAEQQQQQQQDVEGKSSNSRVVEYAENNNSDLLLTLSPQQRLLQQMQKSLIDAQTFTTILFRNLTQPISPEELIYARKTIGVLPQIRLFLVRGVIQSSRGWQTWVFDVCLVLLAGLFLGLVYFERFYIGPEPASVIANCPLSLLQATPSPCKLPRDDPLPGQSAIACISLALCACIGSLGLFGRQKVTFWRESARGVSTLAYFIGYELAHSVNIVIASLCFTIPFYQLVSPLATFGEYYGLALLMYWTASGWGYLVSIAVPPAKAHLFGVLVVLVNMMFSGANPTFSQLRVILGGSLLWLTNISYIRWASEAWYLTEIQYYQATYDDIQTGMDIYEYRLSRLGTCLWTLFGIGVVVRILAFIALVALDRDKRK